MGRERIGNTKESTKHQWKIRENQYLHCSSTGNEWANQLEIKLKGKISQKLHWDKIKAYEREGKINQINLRNILQKASTTEELENKVGIHKNERHIQSREKRNEIIKEEKCSYERTQKAIKIVWGIRSCLLMCYQLTLWNISKQVKHAQFLLTDISNLLKHIGTIIYLLKSFQWLLTNSPNYVALIKKRKYSTTLCKRN